MIVYKATNTENNKIYIGKTIRTLSHAKARHKQRAMKMWQYGCNSRFYSAIRKYGFDKFTWEIVYTGQDDQDIQKKEREFIHKLNSMSPSIGYNMTPGGDGGAGKTLSDSQKAKLSIAFSGDKNPCSGRFGQDHPAYGNKHSDAVKQIISETFIGKPKTAEHKEKLSKSKKFIASLPDAEKQTMLDMKNSGKTFQEIADVYGISKVVVAGIITRYLNSI